MVCIEKLLIPMKNTISFEGFINFLFLPIFSSNEIQNQYFASLNKLHFQWSFLIFKIAFKYVVSAYSRPFYFVSKSAPSRPLCQKILIKNVYFKHGYYYSIDVYTCT